MSMLRFPKPPDGQKIIAIVVGVIRGILRKISEKASKTESTSDNSSIENIDNIIQLLNEYKESVNIHTIKIENAVFKEIQYYSEELFLILDEYSEKIEGYNIRLRMIKKKINDLSSEFNGNIDNYISKKLSLSDKECCSIMKMIPGSKKEEALNEFFSKVLKEAIDNSCAELKKCLGSIFMDVEIEIQDALQSNLSRMQDIRLRLNECLDNQNHIAIQSSLINACYKIETCDQIMKIIEQE